MNPQPVPIENRRDSVTQSSSATSLPQFFTPPAAAATFAPKYTEKRSISQLTLSSPKTSQPVLERKNSVTSNGGTHVEAHVNLAPMKMSPTLPTSQTQAITSKHSTQKSSFSEQIQNLSSSKLSVNTTGKPPSASIEPILSLKLPYTRYLNMEKKANGSSPQYSSATRNGTTASSMHSRASSVARTGLPNVPPDVRTGSMADLPQAISQHISSMDPTAKAVPPLCVLQESKRPSPKRQTERTSPSVFRDSTSYKPQSYLFSRPTTQGSTYTRSGVSFRSSATRSHPFSVTRSDVVTNYSVCTIQDEKLYDEHHLFSVNRPYLKITNALELYFHYHLYQQDKEEQTVHWIPASFIMQLSPKVTEYRNQIGVTTANHSVVSHLRGLHDLVSIPMDRNRGFIPMDTIRNLLSQELPGYLLMSSEKLYVFRPKSVSQKHSDPSTRLLQHARQQIDYEDPSCYVELLYTIEPEQVVRMDIGPGSQFLVLHFQPSAGLSDLVYSMTFMIRESRFVDDIASKLEERVSHINRNSSWFNESFEERVLLRPGRKALFHHIHDSFAVCDAETKAQIKAQKSQAGLMNTLYSILNKTLFKETPAEDNANDRAVPQNDSVQNEASASSLLPDTIQDTMHQGTPEWYQSIAWVMYANDRIGSRTCSLVSSGDHLYLCIERLDVWPSLHMPDEYLQQGSWMEKGVLCDLLSPHDDSSLLKVLPLSRITRCERWKTWRWTTEPQISQLNSHPSKVSSLLQNGLIGMVSLQQESRKVYHHYRRAQKVAGDCSSLFKVAKEVACGQGWPWMIRLYFSVPYGLPEENDVGSHYVDLLYAHLSEADRFIGYLKRKLPFVEVLLGDD